MTQQVVQGDVEQIVQAAFATMMNLEISRCSAAQGGGEGHLTSAVRLSGGWNGVAVFECSADQARRLAGRFLSMEPPEAVDEVVRDVLGELANMIGGNMKCILSCGKVALSLPMVCAGTPDGAGEKAMRHQIAFDSDEGVFWVKVFTDD